MTNTEDRRQDSGFRIQDSGFRRQRASALILVMLILAGIITVVLGTQRLALIQLSQSTGEEDNHYAYYAAKSGIEDGLIRFRYDRNVETPENKVHRFNLTSGENLGEVNENPLSTLSSYNPAHQYYDLKINYKTNQLNDPDRIDQAPILEQDRTLELTGFAPNPNPYYLRYVFQFVNCSDPDRTRALVQMQVLSDGATLDQITVHQPAGGIIDSRETGGNLLIRADSKLISAVRIRPYSCGVRYAFTTALSQSDAGGGPKFDALTGTDGKLITKITSTGYFGKAKRTLVAEIDRLSGTLLHIYDFNLYAGNNISP